jgi:hypothetical protein
MAMAPFHRRGSSANNSLGHPVKLDDLPWLKSDRIPLLGVGEVLPRGSQRFFSFACSNRKQPTDLRQNTSYFGDGTLGEMLGYRGNLLLVLVTQLM